MDTVQSKTDTAPSNLSTERPSLPVLATRLQSLVPLLNPRDPSLTFWSFWMRDRLLDGATEAFRICESTSARRYLDIFRLNAPLLETFIAKRVAERDTSGVQWIQQNGFAIDIPESDALMHQWIKYMQEQPTATPETLDHYALHCGFGYKAANYMVLADVLSSINSKLKCCRVCAPPALPISHYEVLGHLNAHSLDLGLLWTKFVETWTQGERDDFLINGTPLQLTPKHTEVLASIRKRLGQNLSIHPFNSLQLSEWLAKHNPRYVIVRSTGMEDSPTLSNAGGNASLPFIKPDSKSISTALEEVVCSYFGERSIAQRLAAKDRSLVAQPLPFIPCLVQIMVMENPKISSINPRGMLRSGVMFANPPEQIPGTVIVQTGLGNNEGVVTGSVAVDTYVLAPNGDLDAVIRPKRQRLVQDEQAIESGKSNRMVMQPTPSTVVNRQALHNGIVRDLGIVARELGFYYGGKENPAALDMEYSVDLADPAGLPVIYIFQTRPLIPPAAGGHGPDSYIDHGALSALKDGEVIQGQTLIKQISPVRHLLGHQIKVAETLLDVADACDDLSKDYQVAIYRRLEPMTSHPAVRLRARGIPVLRVADQGLFSRVDLWVKGSGVLTVCPQRGLVVLGHHVKAVQGHLSYPLPLERSISSGSNWSTVEGIQRELMNLLAVAERWSPTEKTVTPQTLGELFEQMATQSGGEALQALQQLIFRLSRALKARVLKPDRSKRDVVAQMMLSLRQVVDIAEGQARNAFMTTAPQSLQRLYPIRMIQAAVMQSPTDVVNGYSFKTALQMERTLVKLTGGDPTALGNQSGLEQLMLRTASMAAYSPRKAQDWIFFVSNVPSRYRGKLIEHVLECRRLRLLDLYINRSFGEACSITKDLEERAKLLDKDFVRLQPLFKWISSLHSSLDRMENEVDRWAEPSYFQRGLPVMAAITRDWLLPETPVQETFKGLYRKTNSGGRLALLSCYERTLDVCDRSIKSLKASVKYNDGDKVANFGKMLLHFYDLLVGVFGLFERGDDERLIYNDFDNASTRRDGYLKRLLLGGTYRYGFSDVQHPFKGLKTLTEETFDRPREQLAARQFFNVSALAVLSRADLNFSVHWPTTMEEHFTAIHENVKRCLCFLSHRDGLDASLLPQEVGALVSALEQMLDDRLAYIHRFEERVVAGINVALRQHSALIEISYVPARLEQEGLQILFQAFGNDEHRRWDQLAYVIPLIVANEKGLQLLEKPAINYADPTGVRVVFRMDAAYNRHAELASAMKAVTKWMTMSPCGNDNVIKRLRQSVPIDWSCVSDEQLAHSPQVLTHLISECTQSPDQHPIAVRAAKAGLVYLLDNEKEEYDRGTAIRYAKDGSGSSLIRACLQTFEVMQERSGIGTEEVVALLKHPGLEKVPAVMRGLTEVRASMLPPRERLVTFLSKDMWYEGLRLVSNCKAERDELVALYRDKAYGAAPDLMLALVERMMLDEVSQDLIGLLPEKILEREPVVKALQLKSILDGYRRIQRDFDGRSARLWAAGTPELACDCFIGLCVHAEFTASVNNSLKGYDQYLGKAPYVPFIVSNEYNDTTKIHKASSIQFIRAFESGDKEDRKSAIREFERLIQYFVLAGHTARLAPQVKDAIARLVAFLEWKQPAEAAELKAIFKGNKVADDLFLAASKVQ